MAEGESKRDNTFRPASGHDDQWREDLNPNFLAGQNHGVLDPHPGRGSHTLYDYKDIQRQLHGLSDAELKRIPVMPVGSRLAQGATYIDLYDQNAQPFTATGNMTATEDNLFIPKEDVDYLLWNQLTGVQNPARLDEATDTPPPTTGRA